MAGSDLIASGVLQAIYQQGLRVPEDISVIGYDDTFAPLLCPPLTSVQQPVFEIGVEAVKLAVGVLENPEDESAPYKTHRLQTGLVVRKSTGTPRRSFPI